MLKFEWDADKAQRNLKKHGISFELASEAFRDPMALVVQDRFENDEFRWKTIGYVREVLLVLVAHTVSYELNSEVIRIISARRADKRERKAYEQKNG
jgi:uncharacterized DUF497 family protein